MKILPLALFTASLLGGSLAVGAEARLVPTVSVSQPLGIKKGATVAERVTAILLDLLPIKAEQVTPAARLVEDLGADLYDLVQIVIDVEDEFKISIPDEDAEKIATVGDLTDYVARKSAK